MINNWYVLAVLVVALVAVAVTVWRRPKFFNSTTTPLPALRTHQSAVIFFDTPVDPTAAPWSPFP